MSGSGRKVFSEKSSELNEREVAKKTRQSESTLIDLGPEADGVETYRRSGKMWQEREVSGKMQWSAATRRQVYRNEVRTARLVQEIHTTGHCIGEIVKSISMYHRLLCKEQ